VRALAALAAGEARACETAARLGQMLDDPGLDVRIRAAQALLLLGQAKLERASSGR
jgi:HEAT repeat protein